MSEQNQEIPSPVGGKLIERIAGLFVFLAGVWLLVFGIPMHIELIGYENPSPRLFPQIGAWLFVVTGLALTAFPKTPKPLPDLRLVLRYILVSALLLIMVVLMENFGFLIGAMALLAALMVIVYEKRWMWIGIAVVAMPVFIWLMFEIVLKRPLP